MEYELFGLVGIIVTAAVGSAIKASRDLKKARNENEDSETESKRLSPGEERKLYDLIKEMHALHDRRDEDGVPVWYVTSSLQRAILNISDNTTALVQAITLMSSRIDELEKDVRDIKNK